MAVKVQTHQYDAVSMSFVPGEKRGDGGGEERELLGQVGELPSCARSATMLRSAGRAIGGGAGRAIGGGAGRAIGSGAGRAIGGGAGRAIGGGAGRRGFAVTVCETPADYEASVSAAGDNLVVAYYTAAWCGPCKQIAPIYEAHSDEYADVAFLKIDVDDNDEQAANASISMMPTFKFLKGGAEVASFSGADPSSLAAMLKELA